MPQATQEYSCIRKTIQISTCPILAKIVYINLTRNARLSFLIISRFLRNYREWKKPKICVLYKGNRNQIMLTFSLHLWVSNKIFAITAIYGKRNNITHGDQDNQLKT